MIDEVQCGMGRTGKWFAHQWAGIVPDVMPWPRAWAQACRSGAVVPAQGRQRAATRATTAPPSAATRWPCARGETIRIMEEDGLLAERRQRGAHLQAALQREPGRVCRGRNPRPGPDDRHQLDKPCGELVGRARREAGLLISVTADKRDPPVPPLILTTAEADEIVAPDHPWSRPSWPSAWPNETRDASAMKHYLQFSDFSGRRIRLPVRTRRVIKKRSRTYESTSPGRPHAGHDLREGQHAHARELRGRHVPDGRRWCT